ncbi:hypothetical protein VSR68_22440 [Paraburkholderia phymatum]|uniref:hypothetical protein n=1 Tax=Paraburkholderia phymatum TaxID=148447 RepID=UPI003176510A
MANAIRINSGVDIIGTKITGKTGSFSAKHIPALCIIIEDTLARAVIDCLFSEEIHIPRRYIYSGAWANQASCLYGFFTYGLELSENYNIPSFGVLAITDGDVSEKSIQKRINELIRGNYKNTDQITI